MSCELFYLCYAEKPRRGFNLGVKMPSQEDTFTEEKDLPKSLVGQRTLTKEPR